jgi:hypothetical protein
MTERNEDKIKRVAIELDRLDQEVGTLQRLLDENGLEHAGEHCHRTSAHLPRSCDNALNSEIVAILGMPAVKDRLLEQGAEPVGDAAEHFAEVGRPDRKGGHFD